MKRSMIEHYCCGCGLCGGSVDGKENDKGYFRPNLEAINGDFDFSVCYCNNLRKNVDNGLWGKYEKLYYGFSNNKEVRKKASSGGMLTEIAAYLLESKKADVVIQVSRKKEDAMKTEVVFSKSRTDVLACAGSRYTASSALLGILERMEKGKKYAVIGKPCDISVLRNYMEKKTELKQQIICLLSFFCGGTPSFQANEKLLQSMSLRRDRVTDFTYRGNGWPGETVGVNADGTEHKAKYEESWGKILGRDLQDICRFCWEGVGESADISCGDGWYIVDGKPSFEENDGRNIVIARSELGVNILKHMEAQKRVTLAKIKDEKEVQLAQPGQLMRKAAMFSRVLAMRLLRKQVPEYSIFKLLPYTKYLSFTHNFKMFGGTIRRIKNGQIQ